MRLDDTAHTSRPWRIHEIARDFQLADVFALPTPGGPGDLGRLAEQIAASDESLLANPVVRALFAVRMKIGGPLGMVKEGDGFGQGLASLRERLPEDLRTGPRGPDIQTFVPFPSVYLTETEWVAECASQMVHMVQHVGWVPDGSGGYRGQMATLVRSRGRLGRPYMAFIAPFRRLIVMPAQVRSIGRDWQRDAGPGD